MPSSSQLLPGLGLTAAALAAAACGRADAVGDLHQAICPPPDLFEHAVCVCDDFAHVGELVVEPGPAGVGSVGVNGATDLVARATVAGSWITGGAFSAVGAVIGDELRAGGDASWVGDMEIGGDASIGGDLDAVGNLSVGGTLAVGGAIEVTGDAVIGEHGDYQAAGTPCGCDPQSFFDVAAAVDAAAATAAGETRWDTVGAADVHLATGTYYLAAADLVGTRTITIDGAVSVFVDGDLGSVGTDQWIVATGGSLDLFVSGSVASVGTLAAGDPDHPDAFRLYIGGSDTAALDAVGTQTFAGSIYAPRAALSYVGDTTIIGSVFARELSGVGRLTIAYGRPIDAPTSCSEPPTEVVQ